MTVIINATQLPRETYIDTLNRIPVGGYIWNGSGFIKKTGWRSSVKVDFRHIDHEPAEAELVEYALEMAAGARIYNNRQIVPVKPVTPKPFSGEVSAMAMYDDCIASLPAESGW